MTPKKFVAAVRAELEPLADPALARPMSAYMKKQFQFLGIHTPARRAATKSLVRAQTERIIETAEALWNLPCRDYQYIACDLLQRHAGLLPASAFRRVLALAMRKSWWDTVDSLAKTVGVMVRNSPQLAARMDALAVHENIWLRRIAILHQLGFGEETDAERLFRICLANAGDREFFIRKAIGWALRELAHHDPATVRGFLKQHGASFSALTLREAARHL